MDKSALSIYKLPLLISLVLSIVLLAVGAVRETFSIASVLLGTFAGTFVLDFEFILNAYFFDTQSDFSKTLLGFVKHSDWNNAVRHIYYHKQDVHENSLNSALFQIVLAVLSIFVVYSSTLLFAKSLIVTVFAQSIYVLFEYYFKGQTDDWFWALKAKPSKQGVHVYIFVLLLVLSYCLYVF